jgi:hypothetical protein
MEYTELIKISNPKKAYKNLKKYLPEADLYFSNHKNKKYAVYDPIHNKMIHFGSNLEDYTFHRDKKRRENYLKRANGIKGNWRSNPYSPNNLAINVLWM